MLPAAMKSLGLALLALLLCPSPGELGRGAGRWSCRGERHSYISAPATGGSPHTRGHPVPFHLASSTVQMSLILRGPHSFLLSRVDLSCLGTYLSLGVLCEGVRARGRQDGRYSDRVNLEAHLGLVGLESFRGVWFCHDSCSRLGRGGVGFCSPDLGSPGHPSLHALPSLWPVVPGLHPGQFHPLRPEAVPAH